MGEVSSMQRLFIVFSILFCFGFASAEEQLLLTATNDQDSNVDKLILRLDKMGQPTHLIHRQSGKAEKSYSPGTLSKGVVLRRQSGKDLLKLTSMKFDPAKGASVVLDYLYSGIPPAEYKASNFALKREKGKWALYEPSGKKPLKRLHFVANTATVLGFQQAVGIREVKYLY